MTTISLPDNVVHTLVTAKYLHLGTSLNDIPHVALMRFIYHDGRIIVVLEKNSTTAHNITGNSKVSVLVHDWTRSRLAGNNNSNTNNNHGNSLEEILLQINMDQLSALSITLQGNVKIITDEKQRQDWIGKMYREYESQGSTWNTGSDSVVVDIEIVSARVADLSCNRLSDITT